MPPNREKADLDHLLRSEGQPPESALARGAWLRRFLAAGPAARASELIALRARAHGRFELAEALWLTPGGLEQSTHPDVARARALRIHELVDPGAFVVLDATCGMGGESHALVEAGFEVVAADRDEESAGCARHNLGLWLPENRRAAGRLRGVVVADALSPAVRDLSAVLLVVDPSRRPRGERTLRGDDWSPPWRALAAQLHWAAGACVKLAPAARPEELEAALPSDLPRHWQWVGRRGEVAELCLWTGVLARPSRRGAPGREAYILARDGGAAVQHLGAEKRAEDLEPLADPLAARWLAIPDPTLIASGLLGPVARAAGLAPVGSGIGFLGGEHPARTGGLRDLAVRAACKLDRKAVRRLLGEHNIGAVTVLGRGLGEAADELARRLAGPGSERGLLVAARCDFGRCVWLVDERATVDGSPPGPAAE